MVCWEPVRPGAGITSELQLKVIFHRHTLHKDLLESLLLLIQDIPPVNLCCSGLQIRLHLSLEKSCPQALTSCVPLSCVLSECIYTGHLCRTFVFTKRYTETCGRQECSNACFCKQVKMNTVLKCICVIS